MSVVKSSESDQKEKKKPEKELSVRGREDLYEIQFKLIITITFVTYMLILTGQSLFEQSKDYPTTKYCETSCALNRIAYTLTLIVFICLAICLVYLFFAILLFIGCTWKKPWMLTILLIFAFCNLSLAIFC